MPRLLDRYLFREIAGAVAASALVLSLITVGVMLTATLERIARGKVPAALLFSQIGLRSLDAFAVLLPLALFIGVLLAYGRLYRDSEMSVISASGITGRGLLRPVMAAALPLALLVGALSLWLAPAAVAQSEAMVAAANRSLLVAGLEPGRFVELPGRNGVVYVAAMAADGRSFTRLFVQEQREERIDLTTAARGFLYTDRDGRERYLALEDGFRVEGTPGSADYRTMRFRRNDLRLPEAEAEVSRKAERARTTPALLERGERGDVAELHWRLALPLSTLVLALLALPLARVQPREPRYGRLLIAVLAYVVYSNLLALGRGLLADGTLPLPLGLWWVHALALICAVLLLRGPRLAPRRA